MLKFRIRQAGGCGRRPKKSETHTTKPNVQTQKSPRNPPEAPPEAPRRRPEAPRRRPEAFWEARGRPPEASEAPPKPGRSPRKRGHQRPPKAPRGPEAPGRFRSSEGHDREKPTTFPEDPERVSKRSRQDLGSKPGQIREEWEFRASARNPKRYKVGVDACVSRGWERETNTPVLGLLRTRDAPSHDMPPPHTPGCVGAPYLHVTFSAAARRDALNPKP